jgi:hypothetical protein
VALPIPSAPPLALDTSEARAPVHPALVALEEAPPTVLDRLAIARAALAALPFPDARTVVAEWRAALPPAQQAQICWQCPGGTVTDGAAISDATVRLH